MAKYLHLFDTASEFNEAYNGESYEEPWVSYTEENTHVDYNKWVDPRLKEPFTIEITSPGHLVAFITCYNVAAGDIMGVEYTFEYKKNDDAWSSVTLYRTYAEMPPTWDFVNSGTSLDLTVTAGDVIQFRSDDVFNYYGAGLCFGGSERIFPQYTTAGFKVRGNAMSWLSSTDFQNLKTLSYTTSDPFRGMFSGCSGLTDAGQLILPATELIHTCYEGMFIRCSSLVAAPELPAPTLTTNCYNSMFNGCSNLNLIKCLATGNISSYDSPTGWWLKDVASSGTFIKDANATWPTGDDGIPTGWTVVNA